MAPSAIPVALSQTTKRATLSYPRYLTNGRMSASGSSWPLSSNSHRIGIVLHIRATVSANESRSFAMPRSWADPEYSAV